MANRIPHNHHDSELEAVFTGAKDPNKESSDVREQGCRDGQRPVQNHLRFAEPQIRNQMRHHRADHERGQRYDAVEKLVFSWVVEAYLDTNLFIR